MDRHELQRNCPEMRETLGTSFVSRKWKVEQSFGQDRNRTTHEIPREGEFRYPARREKRRAPKKQTAHGQRLPSRWTLKTLPQQRQPRAPDNSRCCTAIRDPASHYTVTPAASRGNAPRAVRVSFDATEGCFGVQYPKRQRIPFWRVAHKSTVLTAHLINSIRYT